MAWVTRGRRRYYYQPVREGKLVRQVYYGSGPMAELAAEADELRRAERRAKAFAWQEEEGQRQAADRSSQQVEGLTDLLMRAALVAAGFHRHDRGAWRRSDAARG
jgi:hypothetical protein